MRFEQVSIGQRLGQPVATPAQGGLLGLTLTPVSVATATVAEQNFTVAGLLTTDRIAILDYNTGNATGLVGARCSAANTLTLRFVNPTGAGVVPGAGVYNFEVIRQQ